MPNEETTKITQDGRLLKIDTPLGPDNLLLQEFRLTEEISRLPVAECVVLREATKDGYEAEVLDVPSLMGQEVTVYIESSDKTRRSYNGIVTRCVQKERDHRFTYYSLEIRPSIWRLTQNQDSRIFQRMTVPQIIAKVIGEDHTFQDVTSTVAWEPRNYTVQYRESDFNFISRLMEEEGIFYFFEYEEDQYKMMICVDNQAHTLCPSKSEIPFFTNPEASSEERIGQIESLWVNYQLTTGKVELRDFTHQNPKSTNLALQPSRFDIGRNQEMVHYLFPAGSARKHDIIDMGQAEQSAELSKIANDVRRNAEVRQEAFDTGHKIISGTGQCCSMTAGHKFKLVQHHITDLNRDYVITSVQHSAIQNPAYYGEEMPDGHYTNAFECISWGENAGTFRPQQVTPKPMVLTSQTATVVGKSGQEIYTDKYGRVKIQFHWDREGEFNEGSSCWARVAQNWAGNRWGAMFIPRVGMEVLVHFLEGDPDQPIITGCVYNNDAMPAYELPENKNLSGIKSDSTLGGDGYNEWRFDDTKGEEQIFIHGQYDMDIRIENDRRELTKNDQHLIIKNDQFEKVENDLHQIVENDHYEHIKRDRHLKVGTGKSHKEAKEVTGSQSLKIGGDQGISISGSKSEEVTGAMYLKGMNVVVEAMGKLSLKVGGSFVDISPAGVSISGPLVNINSGGGAGSGSAKSIVPPTAPKEADEAADDKPGSKMKLQERSQERKKEKSSKENKKKKSWIELKMIDEEGKPVPGQRYRIKTSDGKYRSGTLDDKGEAHVKGIEPGSCEVTFPDLDKDAWEDA